MRLRTLATITAALALTAAAQPAYATVITNRAGSCNLSAHWTVSGSARWYDSDLAYAVISSPAPLDFPDTFVVGFSPTESPALGSQGVAPPYVWRADFNSSGSQTHVTYNISGGVGSCSFTLTK